MKQTNKVKRSDQSSSLQSSVKQPAKFGDPLHSSDRDQKIISFTVGIAVAVALSHFIPGFDYLQAAGMVIDVIDPYNYNNSFTRDGMNKLSQNAIDDVVRKLNDPKLRQPIFDSICATYNCQDPNSTITPDMINNILDHYLAYWKQQIPTVKSGCYGDLATNKTFSGHPTADCYPVYTQAYDDYYNKNYESYVNGNYATEVAFNTSIITFIIDGFKRNVFTFCAVIIGIFFIIFIILLIYKWRR